MIPTKLKLILEIVGIISINTQIVCIFLSVESMFSDVGTQLITENNSHLGGTRCCAGRHYTVIA